jgi:ParB-like chromosome segregation protein Spo0J
MPARWLETRLIPVDELTPFPGNARRGLVKEIQRSLRANGQYRSLVVRQAGGAYVVLAGNHTKMALEAEGHAEARCELIECTDAEARRINLVDNRLSDLATDDQQALAALLAEIEDPEGTGYTPRDIARITGTDRPEPGDAPVDDLTITWGVIIECDTEAQQDSLLARFIADGLDAQPLMARS